MKASKQNFVFCKDREFDGTSGRSTFHIETFIPPVLHFLSTVKETKEGAAKKMMKKKSQREVKGRSKVLFLLLV